MKNLVFTIFSLVTTINIFAQGLPFIRNFSTEEYKMGSQNWEIAQDERGFIYVSNTDGLIEYDGAVWNNISISPFQAMSVCKSKIYTGTIGEFGYFEPNIAGKAEYFSLTHLVPKEHLDFNNIWKIFETEDKVYFFSDFKIFVYHRGKLKVVQSEIELFRTYLAYNTVYVQDMENNLYYFNQTDELSLVNFNFDYKSSKIQTILPYKDDYLFITTLNGSFLIPTKNVTEKILKLRNFERVDDFLTNKLVSSSCLLKNNDIVIGTHSAGIIVFDIHGNIKNIYDKSSGLASNQVYDVMEDFNGHIWAGLDNGISYIHHNCPFQIFDERAGLDGLPYSLSFFDNNLYVGTSQNLLVMNQKQRFTPIKNTEGQNFYLLPINNQLLITNSADGIMLLEGNRAKNIHPKITGFSEISPLQNHPNSLLVGGVGLYLLEYKNNQWKLKHKLENFDKNIYFISQDDEGNIWASTYIEIYKIQLNENLDSVLTYKSYNTKGLTGEYFFLHVPYSGRIIISSDKGLFSYNSKKDQFEPSLEFTQLTGDISFLYQDNIGNIWFEEKFENGANDKGFLKPVNGKYEIYKTPFYKFSHLYCAEWLHNIYVTPDTNVYFGTNKGILHYNPKIDVDYDVPFNTFIRRVYSKDSLLFDGFMNFTYDINITHKSDFDYKHNNFTFHFSALFYEDAEKNLYSFRLLGLDSVWSGWLTDHKKDYTNLSEGKYIFEVKAMNQYKKISKTATYTFEIKPPWYRTWWAYTLAIVSLLLLIFAVIKIYVRRIERQKAHLEMLVKQRTQEIVLKNIELEQQKEEILTQNEEILAQKEKIEHAHQQITASIKYARRIQNAVLPSKEFIQSVLPEHFIFFKPRDVVSGDFYYFKQINEIILVVAADCTGHGVPGAFMSMLGVTLLNEICQKKQLKHSNIIVNELRTQIKEALQQTGKDEEQKDGMDIALCIINKQSLEMNFSGAYNPCYICRQTENEIEFIELKADRMPVGVYIKEKDFSEQFFQLQKNDMIYVFSDGFQSQFGVIGLEKYKTKRFKNFILSICNQPVVRQKELLDAELKNWQKHIDQTDDILIIGVRI